MWSRLVLFVWNLMLLLPWRCNFFPIPFRSQTFRVVPGGCKCKNEHFWITVNFQNMCGCCSSELNKRKLSELLRQLLGIVCCLIFKATCILEMSESPLALVVYIILELYLFFSWTKLRWLKGSEGHVTTFEIWAENNSFYFIFYVLIRPLFWPTEAM